MQDANRVPEEVSMAHIVEVGSVPFFGLVYKLTQLFVQDKPAVPPREYHDPMSDAKVRQNMFL